MAPRLVYETHSTTLDNEAGIATGWLPGKLSATGRAHAREMGRRRRADELSLLICSDLARAVETVEIAFAGSNLPVRRDPRLRECNYGSLNGASVERVHAVRRQHVDTPFPGGQSYRGVAVEVEELLRELAAERPGERVLLVGHAATRFALDHLLTGRPLETALLAPFNWRPGWEYDVADRPVVTILDGAEVDTIYEELAAVHSLAFEQPSREAAMADRARFRDEQLPTHRSRDGFRCAVLRLAGELVGFAYGYSGARGQWWTDQIMRDVPPELSEVWLGGHFEIVEIAVDPRHHGRGFGTALHDALVWNQPHDKALLTTYRDERPASRLYRSLGWQLLHPEVLKDSVLYGLDLVAWRAGRQPAHPFP